MKKPFRHVGVLMLMSIAALGLIAAAYTLWYEDLSVTANVTTAKFDVDWSCQTGISSGVGTGTSAGTTCTSAAAKKTVAVLTTAATTTNPTLSWTAFQDEGDAGSPASAKYIQTCNAAITSNASAANDTGNNNVLTLTASNLYPFAGCKFALDVEVPGGSSVPAHFTLTSESNNSNGTVKVVSSTAGPDACTQIAGLLSSTSTSTNQVIKSDGTNPHQLHQGDHLFCTFLLYLQELNAATPTPTVVAENTSFTITATIKAHQFNEPAP